MVRKKYDTYLLFLQGGGKKKEEKEKSWSRNRNRSSREWELENKELESPGEKSFH